MAFMNFGKRTLLAGDLKLNRGVDVLRDPIIGTTWFVDATNGLDANPGKTWAGAFLTMSKAFTSAASGDRIYFTGKVREQLSTPAQVFDVRVIGIGTRPRHADSTPAGGETATATWAAPASPTAATALVRVRQQGWSFENILWVGHTDNACIELYRDAESGNSERDAGHTSVIDCRFASGYNGISDIGGVPNVLVQHNRFEALTNFCILGVGNIGAGQSDWEIVDNTFDGFTNGVKISGIGCRVQNNTFTDGGTPNTTVVLNMANTSGVGMGENFVIQNFFQTSTANFNTPDVVGNATDVWAVNASIDSTSAGVGGNFEWGQPA